MMMMMAISAAHSSQKRICSGASSKLVSERVFTLQNMAKWKVGPSSGRVKSPLGAIAIVLVIVWAHFACATERERPNFSLNSGAY